MEEQNNQLAVVLKENPVQASEAQALTNVFGGLLQQAQSLKTEAEAINITSADQVEDMEKARELRLTLKNIRIDADKKRKEMKEESLRKGRAIDGMFNIIKFLIVPLEQKLQQDEDYIKEIEKKRLDELEEKRKKELTEVDVDVTWYNLREMADDTYQSLLANSKKEFEEKKEKERKEEEERIKKEQEEKERLRKIEEENEKLRKEKEEKEKKEAEERKKREEEEAEKERIHQEQLKKEREEKEKLEAEIKAKEEAERKEKEEAERLAKEKAKAPDKEKLKDLGIRVAKLELPQCDTPEGKAVIEGVNKLLVKVSKYIRDNTLNL